MQQDGTDTGIIQCGTNVAFCQLAGRPAGDLHHEIHALGDDAMDRDDSYAITDGVTLIILLQRFANAGLYCSNIYFLTWVWAV